MSVTSYDIKSSGKKDFIRGRRLGGRGNVFARKNDSFEFEKNLSCFEGKNTDIRLSTPGTVNANY